jgi:predicted nucleic acid-binding protein
MVQPQQTVSVVLDASVWVSHTIATDSNHAVANSWVIGYFRAHGRFVAPRLFEVEVAAAISRATKNSQITRLELAYLHHLKVRRLLRYMPLRAGLMRNAATLATDYGLRAADAIYASVAQQLGVVLVTFDSELLELPSAVITTIRP